MKREFKDYIKDILDSIYKTIASENMG